jgi:hypothetical protein
MVQGPSCDTTGHYKGTENIYCVHICPSWLYIMSQTNPIQTLPNYFKICLNSILTSSHKSAKWSFFQAFYPNLCMHFSFSQVCHMTCPYQSRWIDHCPTHYRRLLLSVQPYIKNSPDRLWKLTQAFHKLFSFFGHENWQMTTIKSCFLCIQAQNTHHDFTPRRKHFFSSLLYNSWNSSCKRM